MATFARGRDHGTPHRYGYGSKVGSKSNKRTWFGVLIGFFVSQALIYLAPTLPWSDRNIDMEVEIRKLIIISCHSTA